MAKAQKAEPEIETGKDLITVEITNPATVFVPQGLEPILVRIETECRKFLSDISTQGGRDNIKSLAHKIARSKGTIDKVGKELTEDMRKQINEINAERNRGVDRLQSLQDEIRAPLTAFENKEKDRLAGHETALALMASLDKWWEDGPLTADGIRVRIESVKSHADRDWQEFSERAEVEKNRVIASLTTHLEARIKADKDAEELAALRKAEEDRKQKERDEQIRAEASENARKQVEAEAKKKADKLAADLEAEKAKNSKLEQDRKAALEKAENDKIKAVQAEKDRAAAAKAKEEEAEAKREANKKHCAKINNEALAAIEATVIGADEGTWSKAIISAIAKGLIPHVSIKY